MGPAALLPLVWVATGHRYGVLAIAGNFQFSDVVLSSHYSRAVVGVGRVVGVVVVGVVVLDLLQYQDSQEILQPIQIIPKCKDMLVKMVVLVMVEVAVVLAKLVEQIQTDLVVMDCKF